MGLIVRLAGVSGAAAVIMGAFGAHAGDSDSLNAISALRDRPGVTDDEKRVFETGNRYHLLHSVTLLASPFVPHPRLTAGLLCGGIILFSGTCYYHALTGNTQVRKLTPIGGFMLIFAWLSMVLP